MCGGHAHGDYVPYVEADVYREVTCNTLPPSTPGRDLPPPRTSSDLIEQKAVQVVRPDPLDVGGIAEVKWVAEYADLHGVLMAPTARGTG